MLVHVQMCYNKNYNNYKNPELLIVLEMVYLMNYWFTFQDFSHNQLKEVIAFFLLPCVKEDNQLIVWFL